MVENGNDDGLLVFCPELEPSPEQLSACWNILIVDDEESVHDVTQFALAGFAFEGKHLQFYNAYSAGQAVELLKSATCEFHVILLDIVMEHRHAGLEVITHVRNELKNNLIQIIVRTGQSGLAPEDHLIGHYEINDYKEKNVLTVQRLKTSLTMALRTYRNIHAVQEVVAQKMKEVQVFRDTLRSATFAVEASFSDTLPSSPMSLPIYLRNARQRQKTMPVSATDLELIQDVGLTLYSIQEKIASITGKAIAVFDYTINQFRYVSDNVQEVTGLSWKDLIDKFQHEGHFSPDTHKIERINKQVAKVYSEASDSEKKQFVAVFDYRITPFAPHNIRILEYITPLLHSDQGALLLSLHIFSNVNHLKKASSNSILSLHIKDRHHYFSISDYRLDEIFIGQRELEIIRFSDKNLLSKEIAQHINLSVHTIDTHLRNLRDRFGVTSTIALISYFKEISDILSNRLEPAGSAFRNGSLNLA